mmetsp:Transcript_20118/g.50391  ORF Transcript_20118/g.50391 Transcript_20118/m.50391 type:complete len:302 (-) Transcript_20118:307-1212(-)
MLDALTSKKYTDAVKGGPKVITRADAEQLCSKLMSNQFFHRSQRIFISARRWELEVHPTHTFEEDGLYTWIHEGSTTRLYMLCGLTLAGALLLCMVQIWPIWMKIGLWWCSVTFLTTFGALCAVRLAIFVCMFAVGFRGIWLFPNLFDDNQTFAGSFMPIMGKAEPIVVADDYDSDDDDLRRIRPKKKDGATDAPADATASPLEAPKKVRRAPVEDDPSWKFGLLNIGVLGVIGLIACWNMGFFDGDNVPDFVAKHDDLVYYYPSLPPPEVLNATMEGGGEATGDSDHDPFAAPAGEGENY